MKNLIFLSTLLALSVVSNAQCCLLQNDFKNGFSYQKADSMGASFAAIEKEIAFSSKDTIHVLLKEKNKQDVLVTVITARGGFESFRQAVPLNLWFCDAECPRIVIMSPDGKTLLRLIYQNDKENPYD